MQDEVIIDIENPKDNDAISREAICNIVNDIRDCISVEGYCAIVERLKKLPSINPQPSEHFIDGVHAMGYREGYKDAQKQKSGYWIPIPYELDYETDAECSLCHKKFIDAIDYDYCPKCGYRMRKSEDK